MTPNHRSAPARLEKRQAIVPADLVRDSEALVELDEIGAAAEQHVLAVVDDFAGAGMLVGRSAAAQIGPPLEQA